MSIRWGRPKKCGHGRQGSELESRRWLSGKRAERWRPRGMGARLDETSAYTNWDAI